MTARDAGGIACRIFSLYLSVQGFRLLVSFLLEIRLERLGSSPERLGFSPVWELGARALLMVFAAILCWVKSSSLWPNDAPLESNTEMDSSAWIRISMLVLGAYFFIASAPTSIMFFARQLLPSSPQQPISSLRADESIIMMVLAICVFLYGSIGWPRRQETLV